jgi:hypothetical protein
LQALVEAAVMDDGVAGIAGGEQSPWFRTQRARLGRDLPPNG